jgi:hypothetical protein
MRRDDLLRDREHVVAVIEVEVTEKDRVQVSWRRDGRKRACHAGPAVQQDGCVGGPDNVAETWLSWFRHPGPRSDDSELHCVHPPNHEESLATGEWQAK